MHIVYIEAKSRHSSPQPQNPLRSLLQRQWRENRKITRKKWKVIDIISLPDNKATVIIRPPTPPPSPPPPVTIPNNNTIIIIDDDEDDESVNNCSYSNDKQQQEKRKHSSIVINGVELKKHDLRTLKDGNWLNDEIINAFIYMCQYKFNSNQNVIFANTFLSQLLNNNYNNNIEGNVKMFERMASVSGIRRKLRQLSINRQNAKFCLVVPINLGKTHWSLVGLDFQDSTVVIIDSLISHNRISPEYHFTIKWLTLFGNWLLLPMETTSRKWRFPVIDKEMPQQSNGSDCGVFACIAMHRISMNGKISLDGLLMPKRPRKWLKRQLENQ